MNCQAFKRSLYHFQADELARDERVTCQEHLNACSDCAALLEVEDGLLRGLKRRLAGAPAPPGLATRIRAQLAAEHARRSGWSWIRAPWFVATAASLLLAVLLLPLGSVAVDGTVERVDRDVLVVDRECDGAGRTLVQQSACTDERHLNALRLDDGSYWQVSLDQEQGRALVTDSALRGRRMHVQGLLYRSIRTLELESVEEVSLISALLPATFEP